MPKERVHLLGICGTGMGSFAGLLQAAGYAVRGSDQATYPPMSDKLAAWGIEVRTPYAAANLEPAPDLVIVGNAIRRDNPEAEAVLARGLEHASFPAALSRLFLADRESVVVAGTHGKTTTSSITAHLMVEAGLDPSFLVGGVPLNYGEGFRLGAGPHFVIEGDEYDTAFFDKGPKFLHYRPKVAVLTSLEFDHADIYDSLDAIRSRFEQLVRLVPEDGLILAAASADLPLNGARAPVVRYGIDGDAPVEDLEFGSWGSRFTYRGARFETQLAGRFNVDNAVAALEVGRWAGLQPAALAPALASFRGVARRQVVRAEIDGVRIVDDFAHHPTAVRLTLEALAAQYGGRIIAVFEPRTATSARRHFQGAYAEAFDHADQAVIAGIGRPELRPEERLDVGRLAAEVSARGTPAIHIPGVEEIVTFLAEQARPGDTLVFMSNGGFGDVWAKMESALRARVSS